MARWASGITKIMTVDALPGNSPASINRRTGVMFINKPLIKKLGINKDQLFFIMLHELGHLKRRTKNELEADEWAFEEYARHGGSLKQSVFAVTDWLRFDKHEDYVRAERQLQRAKIRDGKPGNMSYRKINQPYGFADDTLFTEYYNGGSISTDPLTNLQTNLTIPMPGNVPQKSTAPASGGSGFNLNDALGILSDIASIGSAIFGKSSGSGGSSGGGQTQQQQIPGQTSSTAGNTSQQLLEKMKEQQEKQQKMIMMGVGFIVVILVLVMVLKRK